MELLNKSLRRSKSLSNDKQRDLKQLQDQYFASLSHKKKRKLQFSPPPLHQQRKDINEQNIQVMIEQKYNFRKHHSNGNDQSSSHFFNRRIFPRIQAKSDFSNYSIAYQKKGRYLHQPSKTKKHQFTDRRVSNKFSTNKDSRYQKSFRRHLQLATTSHNDLFISTTSKHQQNQPLQEQTSSIQQQQATIDSTSDKFFSHNQDQYYQSLQIEKSSQRPHMRRARRKSIVDHGNNHKGYKKSEVHNKQKQTTDSGAALINQTVTFAEQSKKLVQNLIEKGFARKKKEQLIKLRMAKNQNTLQKFINIPTNKNQNPACQYGNKRKSVIYSHTNQVMSFNPEKMPTIPLAALKIQPW